MIVRPATYGDLSALLRLSKLMHREAPAYRDQLFDEQVVEDNWTVALDIGAVFVAVDEHPDRPMTLGMAAGTITSLIFNLLPIGADVIRWVRPEHRGGPVHLALLSAIEGWAASRGATRFRITDSCGVHDNERSLDRFHAGLGYERVSRTYERVLKTPA